MQRRARARAPATASRADAAGRRRLSALQRRHDLARRWSACRRPAPGSTGAPTSTPWPTAGWSARGQSTRAATRSARYLAAFGPASMADIASWSGIPPAELRPVLESMELRRFRDEQDGLLLDLPRKPLPDPSAKAPVRFLPTWDATLLVHARRTGILPERFRPHVFSTKTPQSVTTFTVDGAVAGTWREEKGRVKRQAVRAAAEGGPPRGGRGGVAARAVHRLSGKMTPVTDRPTSSAGWPTRATARARSTRCSSSSTPTWRCTWRRRTSRAAPTAATPSTARCSSAGGVVGRDAHGAGAG